MPKRIERVESIIQEELGKIIIRELEFPTGSLVTITRVSCSVDLANASVFVAVLPEANVKRVLEILGKMVYVLQQFLNKRLRMRPIPKIRFVEEKQTAHAAKIEGILRQIPKEEAGEEIEK
jgi:ribosome-binding factor A